MIIVMKPGAPLQECEKIKNGLIDNGFQINEIVGVNMTILGVIGDTSTLDINLLRVNDWVEKVMRVQEPFKRANRMFHPEDSVIDVNGIKIGGKKIVVMAGPCSVETEEQIISVAKSVKLGGAALLRGGAFKPRTSPYSFQGLKEKGLELLKIAKQETGLPIVTEIMSADKIERFVEDVDVIQVGARNMQNFELLKELGKTNKPILLKRGLSATIEEWIMSAEYIMAGGNDNVILCERGIRTGMWWMVEPMAKAAIAAGADGLIIEVHNDPEHALCDGAQSLKPERFAHLMGELKGIAQIIGREM